MVVYRDVIPVVGEAVPEGCLWDWGYGEWLPLNSKTWNFADCWLACLGAEYVLLTGCIEDSWLNTLSLD